MTAPGISTVLVVEASARTVVVDCLKDSGLRIVAAHDSASAMETARRDGPVLILLDATMPDMAGFEICRQLKADEVLRDTPVIFTAGVDAPSTRLDCYRAGGVDFITESVGREELQARVRVHVGLQEQRRTQERAVALEGANRQLKQTNGQRDRVDREERARSLVEMIEHDGVAGMLTSGVDATEQRRVEGDRQAYVRFLEALNQVNRAIQRTEGVEQMLWEVVRLTLSILGCDRAWLLFPCDPDAPTYRVPVEATRSGYPGACELNLDVPMKPGADEVCRALLAADGPVAFGPGGDQPLYKEVTEQFGVQSQLVVGVYTKAGSPWMFGLHQCSHPRIWTPEERRLFEAIARRIGDGLSSALSHRALQQSEERFRALVEQAADAFYLLDHDGRILDVNQRACDSLGYSREELLALNIAEVDADVEPGLHKVRFWEKLCSGQPATFEGRHHRKEGSSFPVEVRLGALELDGSKLMLGLARDIGERKRAEETLRAIADYTYDWESWFAPDGRLMWLNPAVEKLTGYSVDECRGMSDYPLPMVHEEERAEFGRRLGQALADHSSVNDFAFRIARKDGSVAWLAASWQPIHNDQGEHIGLRTSMRDVSERMQAEEQRLAHMGFLKSLDRINDAILTGTDPEEMLARVLDTMIDVFQCDRAWLLYPCDPDAQTSRVQVERTRSGYLGALAQHEPFEVHPECCRKLLASGEPSSWQWKPGEPDRDLGDHYGVRSHIDMAICPKVGKAWQLGMHQCSYPRVWTDDETGLFKEIGRRITDGLSSLLFMRALQESESNYRGLVENQPVGLVLHRRNGEVLYANPAVRETLGHDSADDLLGKNALEFIHPDFVQGARSRIQALFETNKAQPAAEERLLRKDGSCVDVEITGSLTIYMREPAIQVLITDITERKRAEVKRGELEAQLRRSQKLEAVGQLAGGVAHDFNNILTAILGNVELNVDEIRRVLGPQHKAVRAMEHIREAALRASTLTRQLLTFSRRDIMQPELLNLNRILTGLDNMLRRLIGENIALTMDMDTELKLARADAGQVEQVIVNLVVNAVQAMPNGGRLSLETRNTVLDEDYTCNHAEARPGPHVLLAVSDTGHGMDAAIMERIFEPFFSTKSMDRGTGLGLAMVHGIVRQSGGHVMVYSEPGHGTTFKVYLPAVVGVAEESASAVETHPLGGDENVLVCEDDRAVRELTARGLEEAGYTVLTASGGREAQVVAAEHNRPIDLLITDVVMPEMNGRQLSDSLRKTFPDLPTLFISGYTSNIIARHGVLDAGVEFLEKPFSRVQLLSRVREVLQKAKGPPKK